jgi:hypothetical protein
VIPALPFSSGGDDFSDLETPDGRPFWTTADMYDPATRSPLYSTLQTGKFFFAFGSGWMYKYLLTEHLTHHRDVGTLDLMWTDSTIPARRWRLYDVEMWAHILSAHGVLDGIQLARTIRIVKLSAELWGYKL